ncbi:acetyl-coenzyme A synthetase N-terminal domain-containing protein, partial [Rhodosalinus sp.]|uniref:acetyl-coenzyme A synthetase N-terminal domain-containing protein n=1 Tax=Rhodosalinus sp. TaxID=2047741 RepID=UPI00397DC4B1
MSYAEEYARWQADPEGWWLEAARAIDWDRFPATALDASKAPLYEWFPDGMVNTCWNAVDRHVAAGHGDR